ncbi:hypothetical protein DIPPA_02557 [Diplonema papillatum]|nr:hypothetical protein DIPPA_02557 [Diplonema papillatum]
MHIDVHTSAPITEAPDHVVWQLNDDAPLENSVPELIKALESKKYAASGTSATDFVHLFILVPAQKARPQDLDPKESGKPMLWTTVAKAPEFFPNRHLILRRLTAEDEEYLNKVKSGEIDPDIPEPPSGQLPDMPPPALEPTGPETGVATMTADIPRYNEVQVSGTLPLQHLKISTLSWKARPIRATPGIRNRPVSTATMCPSCGQPFAMNITDDLAKKQQLTKDMERELDDALEAQRTVLDGERKMLEAEANDLKTAIASVNASLARTRDDGEELRTLSEQQASWTKWLEGEIRQSKAEIGQVGIDFDACLKSNEQLSGVVGSAAASRAESRYHNTNINRRDGPLPNTAPLYLAHGDQSSPTYQPAAAAYSRSYAQKRGETPRKARMRDIVTRYYQKHNPNKLGLVETLVDEYEGKERELLFLMAQKYGDRSILSHDVGEDFAPSRSTHSGTN